MKYGRSCMKSKTAMPDLISSAAQNRLLLNLSKIRFLSPVLGSRLEATLLNDENIMISRQYVAALKVLLNI